MEVRIVEVSNGGDREVEASTEVIDLPALTPKAIKQYLSNRFEVDEEEGANINEMFVVLKKGPVVIAVSLEDFLFLTFFEQK